MRYFVHLAYKGTKYRGWQRQAQTEKTIQEVLEKSFSKMLGQETTLYGCGRTDAEVHANQYILHLDINKELDFDPVFRLNKMLNSDIRIFEFIKVEPNQHARYDAKIRTYNYIINQQQNPFIAELSADYSHFDLDENKMLEALEFIKKQTNFRSACLSPDKNKHTNCIIYKMNLNRIESINGWNFEVSANRFLQCMIRKIVGRILDVGRNQLSLDELKSSFKTGIPPLIHHTAYPQGLYLSKIEYPYLKIPVLKNIIFN